MKRSGIFVPLLSGAMLSLAACAGSEPAVELPASCKEDALGYKRVIEIGLDSPPVGEMLKRGEVVLTFDDGPYKKRTERVLNLLDAECTKATFFVTGRSVRRYPEGIDAIVSRGHSVGNHSFTHNYYTAMNYEAAMTDAAEASAVISAEMGGEKVTMFRFPYVALNPELVEGIRAQGMAVIGVDVDGADWSDISVKESIDLIMTRLDDRERRGVVLLHDPFGSSDKRTRLLLERLKSEKYKVVAIKGESAQD